MLRNMLVYCFTGEELDMRGPMGEIIYKGKGRWNIEGKNCHYDKARIILLYASSRADMLADQSRRRR